MRARNDLMYRLGRIERSVEGEWLSKSVLAMTGPEMREVGLSLSPLAATG